MNTTQTAPAASTPVHVFERTQGHPGPYRVIGYADRTYQACQGAPIQPGASCDHCGTAIRHTYTIKASDGYTFVVGCDCVAKTGDAGLIKEIKALQTERRAAAREARNALRVEGRAAQARAAAETFLAARPELADALTNGTHEIVRDMAAKVQKWGSLSEAQIGLALRLYAEQIMGGAIGCLPPPDVAVPASVTSVKRAELTVTILGTKVVESMYGDTLKALYAIRTPEGQWKAWGTIPSGAHEYRRDGEWKGATFRIRAAVTTSDRDPGFAFLSRPAIVKEKGAA
jgi:hypothetical protein